MSARCVQFPNYNTGIATNCQFTGTKWTPCKWCNGFLVAIFQCCYSHRVWCINFNIIINGCNCQFENIRMPSNTTNCTVFPISVKWEIHMRIWFVLLNSFSLIPILAFLFLLFLSFHSVFFFFFCVKINTHLVCEYSLKLSKFWLSAYGQINWLNCLNLVNAKHKPRNR